MIAILFKNRLFRYALLLTAGIVIGYVYVKGENRALSARIDHQDEVMQQWQKSIIKIAEVPKLNVTNQITGTKVKRGSKLVFVPETEAQLITVKDNEQSIDTINEVPKKPKKKTWIGRQIKKIF
jgi:L-rhamnose mutarotase